MSDLTYPSSLFRFGSSADDRLQAGAGQLAFGLAGNDVLTSTGAGAAGLYGGTGDDSYIARAALTQIAETGGQDTLYLPGYAEDYEGAFLAGRHLLLFNTWTGQVVLVLDFKGAGRIEMLVDEAGERMSADQVQAAVYRDSYGDISIDEATAALDLAGIDSATFNALIENDLVFARLNWGNVFVHLVEAGRRDAGALADAIQYEAMPLLSVRAQQLWDEGGMHRALANSSYEGVAANLPLPPSPIITRAQVEDMALLYQAALDRRPDQGGLNYFVDNLEAGQSLQDIANSFYLAAEFRGQFERFDNASYVDQLYVNVLGRAADQAGLAYWLVDIEQNGRSHADVLVSFAQSAENRAAAAEWLAGLQYVESSDLWMV